MSETFDLQTIGLASSFNFYTNKTNKKDELVPEFSHSSIMPIPRPMSIEFNDIFSAKGMAGI